MNNLISDNSPPNGVFDSARFLMDVYNALYSKLSKNN
jgi:hypothetical protein